MGPLLWSLLLCKVAVISANFDLNLIGRCLKWQHTYVYKDSYIRKERQSNTWSPKGPLPEFECLRKCREDVEGCKYATVRAELTTRADSFKEDLTWCYYFKAVNGGEPARSEETFLSDEYVYSGPAYKCDVPETPIEVVLKLKDGKFVGGNGIPRPIQKVTDVSTEGTCWKICLLISNCIWYVHKLPQKSCALYDRSLTRAKVQSADENTIGFVASRPSDGAFIKGLATVGPSVGNSACSDSKGKLTGACCILGCEKNPQCKSVYLTPTTVADMDWNCNYQHLSGLEVDSQAYSFIKGTDPTGAVVIKGVQGVPSGSREKVVRNVFSTLDCHKRCLKAGNCLSWRLTYGGTCSSLRCHKCSYYRGTTNVHLTFKTSLGSVTGIPHDSAIDYSDLTGLKLSITEEVHMKCDSGVSTCKSPDAPMCKSHCRGIEQCRVWNHDNDECKLGSRYEVATGVTGARSGFIDGAPNLKDDPCIYKGISLSGGITQVQIDVGTWLECHYRCLGHAGCGAYTMDSDSVCTLIKATNLTTWEIHNATGSASGLLRDNRGSCELEGVWLAEVNLDVDVSLVEERSACKSSCRKQNGCSIWATYDVEIPAIERSVDPPSTFTRTYCKIGTKPRNEMTFNAVASSTCTSGQTIPDPYVDVETSACVMTGINLGGQVIGVNYTGLQSECHQICKNDADCVLWHHSDGFKCNRYSTRGSITEVTSGSTGIMRGRTTVNIFDGVSFGGKPYAWDPDEIAGPGPTLLKNIASREDCAARAVAANKAIWSYGKLAPPPFSSITNYKGNCYIMNDFWTNNYFQQDYDFESGVIGCDENECIMQKVWLQLTRPDSVKYEKLASPELCKESCRNQTDCLMWTHKKTQCRKVDPRNTFIYRLTSHGPSTTGFMIKRISYAYPLFNYRITGSQISLRDLAAPMDCYHACKDKVPNCLLYWFDYGTCFYYSNANDRKTIWGFGAVGSPTCPPVDPPS